MKFINWMITGLMLNIPLIGLIAQEKKPNIILIISDDQGYHDLGSYGNAVIKTPNLDQLAEEGVRLTNFYTTGSGCTPSRSGLLTGRYPQRNGTFELFRNNMVNYGHKYTEYEYSVSPERILGTDLREVFISEVLKEAGYRNGYFGKWDLGQLQRYLPLQQGFDDFYGFANTGIDYFTHERYGAPSMLDGNEPTTRDKGIYATDLFERESLEFLRQNSESPFFLYLSFNAPHLPSTLDPELRGVVQATEEYLDLYPEDTSREEKKRRGYMAAVTQMDHAIGSILNEVEKMGEENNTLVIFLSDNGGSLGNADNFPLRGGKAQFFEGGIRVPCIVKWPGQIPPGTVSDEFLSALEIFPTIVNAAHWSLPKNIVYDGFDMMPVLKGGKQSDRTKMFWQFRGDIATRIDNWKWIDSRRGTGLFNLSEDISETTDLSEQYPDILSRMKMEFGTWKKEMENAEPRGPFKDF